MALVLGIFLSLIFLTMAYGPVEMSLSRVLELLLGSEVSSLHDRVLFNLRIPKIMTAIFAGGGLALSGLVLQTWFRNFLADPFLLGINSGSSLFVALFILGMDYFFVGEFATLRFGGIIGAGLIGATFSLFMLILINRFLFNSIYIIIFGLIFSYFCSGIINLLLIYGGSEEIRSFLLWSLGSFQRVPLGHIPIFIIVVGVLSLVLYSFANILNIILLGQNYAQSLGININKSQMLILPIVGALTGIIGVYCGPIVFVGMMGPHITKLWLRTSDHKLLIPWSFIVGATLALLAEFISSSLMKDGLPINSILGIVGAPFLLFLLFKNRFIGGARNA